MLRKVLPGTLRLGHDIRHTKCESTRQKHCIVTRTCPRDSVPAQKVERTTSRTGSAELPSAKHLDRDPFTTPASSILVDIVVTLDEATSTIRTGYGNKLYSHVGRRTRLQVLTPVVDSIDTENSVFCDGCHILLWIVLQAYGI